MKKKTEFFTLLTGYVLQYLIGIVSIRVLTSIISPQDVGRINIITAIALWFNIVINGAIMYVQRKIFEWDSRGLGRKYVGFFILFLFIAAALGSASVVLLKKIFGVGVIITDYWLVILVFGWVFFYNLNCAFINWLNLFKKRILFVVLSNLSLFLAVALSILLSLNVRTGERWLFGQIAGQMIMLCLSSVLFFKSLRPANKNNVIYANQESATSILNFIWPISVASLLAWMQSQFYRFILGRTAGIEIVGLFAIGFGLGMNLINKFEILFNQFYQPVFFKEISGSTPKQKTLACNRYAANLIPAVFIIATFIIINSPFIARLFVGDKFYSVAKDTIIWGVLSQSFMVFTTIYSFAGIAQEHTKGFIMPNVLGAVVTVSVVFLLSHRDLYLGTGFALFIGPFLATWLMRLKMKKVLPISSPKKELILALLLVLPLVIAITLIRSIIRTPNIFVSLLIVSISGIYVLLAMMVIMREAFSFKINFANVVENNIARFLNVN